MALFRHIAFRQTGSLDLSHLVARHSTSDGNGIWLGLQQHWSTLSRASPSTTSFAPSAWIGKRSGWWPPLYDYHSLFAPSDATSGTSQP
jgi:hypothetical protein